METFTFTYCFECGSNVAEVNGDPARVIPIRNGQFYILPTKEEPCVSSKAM